MRRLIIVCLLLAAVASTLPASERRTACLDSMKSVWNELNMEGKYMELTDMTRPFFYSSYVSGDTVALVYAGINMSMAFLAAEKPDSTIKYMDAIGPYMHPGTDPRILLSYYFVRGTYSLKREYNYPKALESYYRTYQIADSTGDIDNSIAALLNVIHIYYVRSDRRGLEYARKAYSLSQSPETDKVAVCMANIAMGEMLYLSDKPDSAMSFSQNALTIAIETGYESIYSDLHLLIADIHVSCWERDGDPQSAAMAEKHYREAIEYSASAETGTVTMLYLHYGRFSEMESQTEKAIDLYRTGLEISLETGNMEFRRELYRRIADLSYKEQHYRQALDFYKSYAFLLDSVASQQKEFQFDSLLLAYQNMRHIQEMNLKEIALLKANRNSIVIASVLALSLLAAMFIWLLYRRQRNMYKSLFEKYQDYASRFRTFPTSGPKTPNAADRELFFRVEEKMKKERLYRQKDISMQNVTFPHGMFCILLFFIGLQRLCKLCLFCSATK